MILSALSPLAKPLGLLSSFSFFFFSLGSSFLLLVVVPAPSPFRFSPLLLLLPDSLSPSFMERERTIAWIFSGWHYTCYIRILAQVTVPLPSVLQIRSGSEFFPSRIQGQNDSRIPESDTHPHQRFAQKIVSRLSENYPKFIPDPDLDFLPIPDPEVKKAPDPGSGSATLSAMKPIEATEVCQYCWTRSVSKVVTDTSGRQRAESRDPAFYLLADPDPGF